MQLLLQKWTIATILDGTLFIITTACELEAELVLLLYYGQSNFTGSIDNNIIYNSQWH